MEGESGEQVEGELESVTSSAGCFVQDSVHCALLLLVL